MLDVCDTAHSLVKASQGHPYKVDGGIGVRGLGWVKGGDSRSRPQAKARLQHDVEEGLCLSVRVFVGRRVPQGVVKVAIHPHQQVLGGGRWEDSQGVLQLIKLV